MFACMEMLSLAVFSRANIGAASAGCKPTQARGDIGQVRGSYQAGGINS